MAKHGQLPRECYELMASTGVSSGLTQFAYFYYYLGLYPVATTWPRIPSPQAATEIIHSHGDTLMTEFNWLIRSGDHGEVWLYLLEAFRRGGFRDDLSLLPPQQIFLIFSLLLLWVAFWYVKMPILGMCAVIFLASNPYLLYETYVEQNIFGLPISVAIVVLAFHLPLIFKRRLSPWIFSLLATGTAAFLGTLRQIRSENAMMAVSVILLYLTARQYNWKWRSVAVSLFIAVFGLTNRGWDTYFSHKINTATEVVREHGGTPYTAYIDHHHLLWHPVWCGLGDFDGKYGYEWNDMKAVQYAQPILQAKYHLDFNMLSYAGSGEYYDAARHYPKRIYDLDEYRTILRDKVLHDISHDPLWYAGILTRRLIRSLFDTTPVRVSTGVHWVPMPFHGLMLLGVVAFLSAFRKWEWLALTWFTLPTALPALLVYSGRGMSYYSIYPQIVSAMIAAWLIEWIWALLVKGDWRPAQLQLHIQSNQAEGAADGSLTHQLTRLDCMRLLKQRWSTGIERFHSLWNKRAEDIVRWSGICLLSLVVLAGLDLMQRILIHEQRFQDQYFQGTYDFYRTQDRRLSVYSALSHSVNVRRFSYAAANRFIAPPNPGESRIVIIGDSIIERWPLGQLIAPRKMEYLNRGIGGQTSEDILARFYDDVIGIHAQAVVILVGTNDTALGMNPQTTVRNIQAMINLASMYKVRVFCGLVPPLVGKKTEIRELNSLITDRFRAQDIVLLDFNTPFRRRDGSPDSRYSGDGIHPNEQGYEIMSRILRESIDSGLSAS